ncbi:MAG TPA: biotin carboxylase N-terminal domain-containing protein [Acidimicrobiales bacterium]|jgi:propionyl-CoA carboxylase alpha chain|nr:biotin carboxylase N-terminal domain-containing protein [Acidimicrobiales bacterium]
MGVLTGVLVANRGEIARRVFRTARAMGLRCVAVYVDADAGAPFVAEADEAVRLHDQASGYLDGPAIIAAARATAVDAIHPGYGFLSENAAFAAAVQDGGLVWVGPPPAVIEAMGDKLAAKRAAEAAGVAVVPSSDDPDAHGAADGVGYPLLVKAAAGGGGKGMRLVESPGELPEAVAAARREAAGAFGDDRVFLEHHVARARHVEIQILGDGHGGLVHLGERECSIQRRHQKIVEESPSPAVGDDLRAAMGDAALRLARAIGYVSAGTVEFLVDDATGEFFFLEVNTRLQVEHPVTEEVTGIDLVREQLRVAAGEPLGYGQEAVTFAGHAVEARLYAEDPAAGFLPASGTLAAFAPPAEPAVRWDAGVAAGSVVGVDFDPMLAKVVAHAPTRAEAAGRLARGLERLHLGGVVTNRDLLAAVLRHPAFLAGDTTTDFLDRVDPTPTLELGEAELERVAALAALWLQGENRAQALVLRTVPSGWRIGRLPAPSVALAHGERTLVVRYRSRRDGTFGVDVDGGPSRSARIHRWAPDTIDAEIDGRRAAVPVTRAGERLYVQATRGTVGLGIVPRFVVPGTEVSGTGGLAAPMPGVVLDVRCEVGDVVDGGQTLVVLEAMKMEHQVQAPADGVVAEVRVAKGQHIENGAVLLVLDPVTEDGTA